MSWLHTFFTIRGSRRYWRKIYGKLQSLYNQQLQNNFVDTETPVSIRGLN